MLRSLSGKTEESNSDEWWDLTLRFWLSRKISSEARWTMTEGKIREFETWITRYSTVSAFTQIHFISDSSIKWDMPPNTCNQALSRQGTAPIHERNRSIIFRLLVPLNTHGPSSGGSVLTIVGTLVFCYCCSAWGLFAYEYFWLFILWAACPVLT